MKKKITTPLFVPIAAFLLIFFIVGIYFLRSTDKTASLNAKPTASLTEKSLTETKETLTGDDTDQLMKLSEEIANGWKIPNLKYEIQVKKQLPNYALVFVIPTNQTLDPLQIIFVKENGSWVYKDMGSSFPDWEKKVPELFSSAQACDVTDESFCIVISDLTAFVSTPNYDGFLAYQNPQSVTCDPEGMAVAICEGAAKGVVKEGFSIGYNQSEGTTLTRDNYLKTVSDYIKTNGPFSYQGSLVSGDKGVAVFLNPKKDHILVFPMKKNGETWEMNHLLVGGTFGDTSFTNLSNSLLDFVQ